jgi:tRNA-specific 2-thiouridylase
MDRREMRKKRVAVAMSGGVDSSVAAALLLEEGFDVIGITMELYPLPIQDCDSSSSCCGKGALADANRVASRLKIPHYVVNMKKLFQKWVVDDFCREYANGRTPNPCIRCNQFIKFDFLWNRAKKMGADYLATGHHARILYDRNLRRFFLKKGKDVQKDQTYFLYTMTQNQLARALMPIGHMTKEEVRRKAKERGLAVHERQESQEICFIPDDDYARFLEQKAPEIFQRGPIVDREDRVLGYHKGICHFTIGQRRGMGIAAPHPLYVLEIHPHSRKIVVGENKRLYKKKVAISRLNFFPQRDFPSSVSVTAKIRYKHKEASALLHLVDEKSALLEFDIPQRAMTPGQSAVFYDKDLVWGGGIIEKADT